MRLPRLRTIAAAATAGPAALLTGQMWWVRMKFRLPPDACGPSSGEEQPASAAGPKTSGRTRNIVFLGDSIVTGVGCSAEASEQHGPVMPRRVASILAQELGASVRWSCLGETGADVRMLQSRLLPKLREDVVRVTEEGQRVDAVVVMTGLNDIKECFLFAQPVSCHPWRFGAMLTTLLSSVCEVAGAGCACVVPGHPIEATPRFNQFWPLSAAVRGVTALWEDQKRQAAEAAQAREAERSSQQLRNGGAGEKGATPKDETSFISFIAPPPSMVAQLLHGADYFAADGMHPNDKGYALWAEIIAGSLLPALERRG